MTYQEKIINHYQRTWQNKYSLYLLDKGPINRLPLDFRVLEFPPSEKRNMWTYATCCMSNKEDTSPIELHIFSSFRDEGLIELLTAVTFFHRNTSLLGLNHTVNFGKSWQKESLCKYGFISLPFLDGPELEDLHLKYENKMVKFYWLIPVTEREVNFKISNGVVALEEEFDKGLDYLNHTRESLV
jgi:hypothetical protein